MQNTKKQIWEAPWPQKKPHIIWPLFMPYLGCKQRCIFCAQELQTGTKAGNIREIIELRLFETRENLRKRHISASPAPELAFYGGTFTAMPHPVWRLCLDFAANLLNEKLISGWRCSTRPDAIYQSDLLAMKDSGCRLVELGAQSFDDAVLAASGRGYEGHAIVEAAGLIRESGLEAGIQLLPGLPGSTPESFVEDVRQAVSISAACLRFYPCLVIAGSRLAQLWQAGQYQPWNLETTLEALAEGWLLAWQARIPVIRMGLAPERDLDKAILAGPRHASLGSRVIGRAFYKLARHVLPEPAPCFLKLFIPPALHGAVWGWKGEFVPLWTRRSTMRSIFWNEPRLRIEWHGEPPRMASRFGESVEDK